MNPKNIRQIFDKYIERFDYINNTEHRESYKWEVAYTFRQLMDEALASDNETFAEKLLKVKNSTYNLIDSYTRPFYGLYRFALYEPEAIRQLFVDLHKDDFGDITVRNDKILTFIKESNKLCDKYYPGSYMYQNDYHSVTGYLFFYDPDHQYLFKQSHARKFADVVGFFESWGTAKNADLTVYYKLCDQMIEEINQYPALLETDRSRFTERIKTKKGEFHPDLNKHILLFDLIYCTSVYELFEGLTYSKKSGKEKKDYAVRHIQAMSLRKEVEKAEQEEDRLAEALHLLAEMMPVGTTVKHSHYGNVEVIGNDGTKLILRIPEKDIKVSIAKAVSESVVSLDTPEFEMVKSEYYDVLSNHEYVREHRQEAEDRLKPYLAYLD